MAAAFRLHEDFAQWLHGQGILEGAGFASYFTEDEVETGEAAAEILAELGLTEEDLGRVQRDIVQFRATAQSRAARTRNVFLAKHEHEFHFDAQKRRRTEKLDREAVEAERSERRGQKASAPPPPLRPRYGSGVRRVQALEGDPQARAKAEEQVRQKWLGVLVQVLKSLEAPSVRKAAASKHAAELIGLQVGTQRARTLRLRVRSWCSMRAWLRSAYGIGHPREAHHFLDYMMDKRAEPCSRGTLQQILSTLRFAEKAMGLQMENRISEDVYVKTAAAGIINATASRAGHKARGPAQSPMMWCIVGLERMVMNGDGDVYGRMLAWWLLVSSWSVLRFDDHRGLASSGICQGALGVSLQFDRTKTTGCDKSVSTRPGLVAWGAWMVEEHWLRTGASLWEEHAPWPRDYFLTQPGKDTVCRPRELGYTEYAGRMRALISNLTVSGYGEAGAAVASFWQPHSWRAFLPSATGAIGAPPELLKWIAAWTAKSGDAYVRTHKEKTQVLQCTCARIMRAYLGADDPLGEHESADKLRRHLEGRGVSREVRHGEAVGHLGWKQHGGVGE